MTAPTPAVERAARELARGDGLAIPWQRFTQEAQAALTAALDVDEITEALAREQWDSLPLVVSGEMVSWDDETVVSSLEKTSFRDRCRPFAEAVRRSILGEP